MSPEPETHNVNLVTALVFARQQLAEGNVAKARAALDLALGMVPDDYALVASKLSRVYCAPLPEISGVQA